MIVLKAIGINSAKTGRRKASEEEKQIAREKRRQYQKERYERIKASLSEDQLNILRQKVRERYYNKFPTKVNPNQKRGRPRKEINYEKYNNSCLLPFKVDEEGFVIPLPSPRLNE
jgi:hypothetical protein